MAYCAYCGDEFVKGDDVWYPHCSVCKPPRPYHRSCVEKHQRVTATGSRGKRGKNTNYDCLTGHGKHHATRCARKIGRTGKVTWKDAPVTADASDAPPDAASDASDASDATADAAPDPHVMEAIQRSIVDLPFDCMVPFTRRPTHDDDAPSHRPPSRTSRMRAAVTHQGKCSPGHVLMPAAADPHRGPQPAAPPPPPPPPRPTHDPMAVASSRTSWADVVAPAPAPYAVRVRIVTCRQTDMAAPRVVMPILIMPPNVIRM